MRDEVTDDRSVKRFKIDEHGFEFGNDFSHEEGVVEFVVVLFVGRVKNHGSDECAETWLVCFGSRCGEGARGNCQKETPLIGYRIKFEVLSQYPWGRRRHDVLIALSPSPNSFDTCSYIK